MACKCGSDRIMSINSKCNDMCCLSLDTMNGTIENIGYVPDDLNIGGGDYIEFDVCLDCGRIQGNFPIDDETVKRKLS